MLAEVESMAKGQPTSLRLSARAMADIEYLKHRWGLDRSPVVERALREAAASEQSESIVDELRAEVDMMKTRLRRLEGED